MKISNIYQLHDLFMESTGVTTDSRKVLPGNMFFALKGENFDGNAFAQAALESGAAWAVVSAPSLKGGRFIHVEDTLAALQDLARAHRAYHAVSASDGKILPVIALTGTNGKTTTKELITKVLSLKYKVLSTQGNLNNHIGVPLTLLGLSASDQIAVIEMGASAPGEIAALARIALPNFGLITNVGKAHLKGFGSFEGVKKAKGELYDYIQRTADKAFVNVDNPVLAGMASLRPDLNVLPYGMKYSGARLDVSDVSDPYLKIVLADGTRISTRLVGDYNSDNVMAALAVGEYFGIPQRQASEAIAAYVPSNHRSQLLSKGDNTYIVDAYNANPTSMAAAIGNMASLDAPLKAVMLGDMLELGDESVAEHQKVLEEIASSMPGCAVFLVGDEFGKALLCAQVRQSLEDACCRVCHFSDTDELSSYLCEQPLRGALVLVKGSHGMRMDKVIC